jgi:hypothetical protein
MPISSVLDLYDFEGQMEAAGKSILTAAFGGVTPPLTPQILISRDSDTEEVPRLELSFTPGAALDQMTAWGQANPKQVPAAYLGQFEARIVTGRPQDNAKIAPIHGILVGATRFFFSAGAKLFTDVNLPYLQILLMLPGPTKVQQQDHKEQDETVLTFDVKFAIRNDAWPTGA